jgi:hypothetical protein
MKRRPIVLLLLAVVGTVFPSSSADLTKIDRTITKEPKYASQPLYALLVFGPEAAKRVWLVLDGEVLYVDRNGNGNLTEANERVELDVDATKKLKVAPGAYKGMNVFDIGEVAGMRLQFHFWVRDETFDAKDEPDILKKYRQEQQANSWENASLYRLTKDGRAQIPVMLCQRPKDAQISHLGGPLTFQLRSPEPERLLKRGGGEAVFEVRIGTVGVPTRNSRYPVFAPLTTSEVPAGVHPVAEFEFPNKAPDQPPLKVAVTLNNRC